VACLRSCSLKAGFLVPISAAEMVAAGLGLPVRWSFYADGSSGAPVSLWTTARKVEGSAWTKVVLVEVGSESDE
jgi:hypothetical protein